MITIANWKVVDLSNNPYLAPELRQSGLGGLVFNHPKFKAGCPVTTSAIQKVEGNIVTTYSGSVYRLGNVDPNYKNWTESLPGRENWDWENEPIKLH